jgi:acetyl esterase/lipase
MHWSRRGPILFTLSAFFEAFALSLALLGGEALSPTPPKQPETGPGGATYAHAKAVRQQFGKADDQFWVYEPADPKPEKAVPVVIFLHGWSAMSPDPYIRWIEHIVRRGNIAIYPRYQDSIISDPNGFTGHAITAIKDALAELQKGEHVRPDLARCATVGHSFGGVLAANVAALAARNGLPGIKAVFVVEPGTGGFGNPYADYSLIPAGTLLLSLAAEEDLLVHDKDALRIFREAKSVKKDDKNYILMSTDRHGSPPLSADHFAPVASVLGADALDWYGFWKWFDGLTDAAFHGRNREFGLGNTDVQRFMGKWSDGTPVKEPRIIVEEP